MASPAADMITELKALTAELRSLSDFSDYTESPQGLRNRYNVVTIANQIRSLVTPASDVAYDQVAPLFEVIAIRTLKSLGVLEKIPDTGSISLEDLSHSTGVGPSLLERLLRLPVAMRFLAQNDRLEYLHTKFSQAYIVSPGPGDYLEAIWQFGFQSLSKLPEYLAATGSKDELVSLTSNPFTWYHDQDGRTIWKIMAQTPAKANQLQLGLASVEASFPTLGLYDFNQLQDHDTTRVILVDVGGGMGHSIAQILEAYPTLSPGRFVLQDLCGPIGEAEKSGWLPQAVIKMEHDFYTEQPVKGARAYYLRRVLHNHSDDACVEILKPLAAAMAPDSVLLISDMILLERADETNLFTSLMDFMMLFMGGKERTTHKFKEILEAAGLKLIKAHRSISGAGALIEAALP